MKTPEEVKKLTNEITNYVNSFIPDEVAFIQAMSQEHRTLQQSFTRLVLKWLEFVASEDYKYDDRNSGSHAVAKKLLEGFFQLNHYRTLPSAYLPFI